MTENHVESGLTLVLGANGKTGSRIAARLQALGRPVRAGSRSASPPFDWEDRATWAAALDGVRAIYVAYQPDLAVPGALETVRAFFRQAVESGARRLVLLSGRGEVEAQEAEEALRESGADWTILRCSWFNQNFSESFLADSVREGMLALPVGPVPEPFIDAEDIADAAVAVLTQPGHSGQLYELTGPRAITYVEAVGIIGRATGREIGMQTITAEAFQAGLQQAQVPQTWIDLLLYLMTTLQDGRNAPVTDGVQRVLGRAPRTFEDYARRTAASGAWAA